MNFIRNLFFGQGRFVIWAVLTALVIWQQLRIHQLQASMPVPQPAKALPEIPPARVASKNPPAQPGPSLHDSRTQGLLDELDEILAAGVPGQVNERFQSKCWEVLLDSDTGRRNLNFGLLLDALRPEDGVALHVLFNKMHQEGRDFPGEYATFATRWGQVDGAGSLRYYFTEADKAPAPADVHNALKGWAQKNPQEALAWAVANRALVAGKPHPGFGPQEDPVMGVIHGWARMDVTGATAAMKAQFSDPETRAQAVSIIYKESLFGSGLNSTLDWIKQLPDSPEDSNEGGRQAVRDVLRRIRDAGTPAPQAATALLSVSDQPWFGLEDMANNVMTFKDRAPEVAEALVTPASQAALQSKFATWSTQNPDALGSWLNLIPGTALYDLGAAELARSLQASDPEAASTWAQTVRNPAYRTRATAP